MHPDGSPRSIAFSLLGWFYLTCVPSWLGLDTSGIDVTTRQLTHSVLIFLGIPLLAGLLTRAVVERSKGADWYEQRFIPSIAPVALYGLLFAIGMWMGLQYVSNASVSVRALGE